MNFSRLSLQQRISAISIVVVAVSAFLPWVSIFGVSVLGVEGDGALTLVLAIAGGVVLALSTGLFGEPKTPTAKSQIALVALAAVVTLIGLIDMNRAAAIGLYFTLFGGIAWLVGSGWELYLARQKAQPSGAPAPQSGPFPPTGQQPPVPGQQAYGGPPHPNPGGYPPPTAAPQQPAPGSFQQPAPTTPPQQPSEPFAAPQPPSEPGETPDPDAEAPENR